MFHPKADENGIFHCGLCSLESSNPEDFELVYWKGPICNRCAGDLWHYGSD